MKSEKTKTVFIIILSVLLVMSIFTQVVLLALLGINNVASLKRVMLASDLLANAAEPEVLVSMPTETTPISTEPEPVVQTQPSQTEEPSSDVPTSTEPSTVPTETFVDNTNILMDDAGVVVTYLGTEFNTTWDSYELKFAIENNSDKNVIVTSDKEVVDGYMTDISIGMYSEIVAGKKAVAEMTLFDFDLEPLGITNPETVEFKLRVTNSEDIFDTITETGVIMINIK
jgi:hypothetical protein